MSAKKLGVLTGFREFLLRGNVVELAVAVVIGAAFTKIVNAVVEGAINPVVGALGTKDLEAYESCLRGPCAWNSAGEAVSGIPIRWGTVLSASLTFLITAAVVYLLMIVPMNKYKARLAARKPEDSTAPTATEVELLTQIRDALLASHHTGNSEAGLAVLAGQRRRSESGSETGPECRTDSRTGSEPRSGSAPQDGPAKD